MSRSEVVEFCLFVVVMLLAIGAFLLAVDLLLAGLRESELKGIVCGPLAMGMIGILISDAPFGYLVHVGVVQKGVSGAEAENTPDSG